MPHKGSALQNGYIANAVSSCTVCSGEERPLNTCRKFRSLSHNQGIAAVKSNQLCFNCLKSGHHKLQCPSLHRCQVRQKPHHTLLHLDDRDTLITAGRRSPPKSRSPPAVTSCSVIEPAFARRKQSTAPRSGTPHDLPGMGHDSTGYHNASKSIA